LAFAAVTSCVVSGWVSLAIALAVDPAGYQLDRLLAGVEIAAAASLLSAIGGFLPAFAFQWLALAWPTRPGSAVWSAMVGLSIALVAAPILGGAVGGLSLCAIAPTQSLIGLRPILRMRHRKAMGPRRPILRSCKRRGPDQQQGLGGELLVH